MILHFRSWISMLNWVSYHNLNFAMLNCYGSIREAWLELGWMLVRLVMYEACWFEWCVAYKFLWEKVHVADEHQEHLGFVFPDAFWSLSPCIACWFLFSFHAFVHLACCDWGCVSFNETQRFAVAPTFKCCAELPKCHASPINSFYSYMFISFLHQTSKIHK